ncbi:MAG: methionine synthase, partial [Actinomycetota bacterium]
MKNRVHAPNTLRVALSEQVVIADGAMGTMLQNAQPSLEDFQGYEGCNEILNVTRPELVAQIHSKYFESGVDAVETNTFGANLANLAEYGISDRIYELSLAGAQIAREVANEFSQSTGSPKWVLGSMGPGTKLPTLGHVTYAELKQAYALSAKGLIDGGSDALLIETTQDLLQAKAAVNGAREAMASAERDVVLIAQVTVETTGTMLLGSEIGAALNSLQALGVDLIGMNCATGPSEMSEHLRTLSQSSNVGISCMPNAGLPILKDGGAYYPLSPDELAKALAQFVADYRVNLVGGCCGTTPEHLAAVVKLLHGKKLNSNNLTKDAGASSLYQFVSFRQDKTYLAIGERSNANGSKAFRDALVVEDWQIC